MSVGVVVQKSARNEAVVAVQAKAKALKEQQRTRLDSRHYYLMEIVAERLQLDANVVEEFLLEGDQVCISLC
jgi:predicted nucleic acid-binding protein